MIIPQIPPNAALNMLPEVALNLKRKLCKEYADDVDIPDNSFM
jgi:hypothetical protein